MPSTSGPMARRARRSCHRITCCGPPIFILTSGPNSFSPPTRGSRRNCAPGSRSCWRAVTGPGGRARAEGEAARLGVERDVRFLGWIDDTALPGLYRGARAHVLASAEETFGRSVLEAMACGCPCVLQDLPVLHEVTGGAAQFTDFADLPAAAAAMAAVCQDDALAARLRAAGLRRAGEFSFVRLARERVGAILRVLGAPAS